MHDIGLIKARGFQRKIERVLDIRCAHSRTQLPGDDVAREVIQDRRQIEPASADYLQIGEVRLPELVGRGRLVRELTSSFHHDEGWAGDQVMRLQQPINTGL